MNLTALQHSAFLQSLGWAIANSLWQAAALWIAYHIVVSIYKNASAKFKHNLSSILLASSFVWFCATFFIKYFAIEDLSGNYEVKYYNANDITAAATWNDLLNKAAGILPYLSAAYLMLLIFFSFRLINIYRFTRFIKFNGLQKPGVEWKLFTEKVARHMGITKKIRLWVSHHIDVPATIGFIKPVILIPLASVNQLSSDQLEAIILHELSHIRRNDYLINLFISIIETVLFFNPFVVLLAKVIKRERENCCDDFVIQYQYDRHAYASALLSLEQFRNINLRLAIGATSGKKQLLLRIKRIMEVNSNTNFNYGQKLVALFLITGIICSVAWLSPQSKEAKKQLLTKSLEKISERKVNRTEKPETIFIKQMEDVKVPLVKNTVKQPSKKVLTEKERQLKEFRDLSLKEIAEREYKLQYRLLQESQKKVVRSIQKINSNKFLMAKGAATFAPFGPTLFDKESMSKAWINANVNYQHALTTAELQKIQSELDKVQFSFSFDYNDVMQPTLKQGPNSKQSQPLMQLRQRVKDGEVEKLIKTEIHNSVDPKTKRTRGTHDQQFYTVSAGGSFYVIDSMQAAEIKALKDRAKKPSANVVTTVESKTVTDNKTMMVYAYGFGTTVNNDKIKRDPVKVLTGTTRIEDKQAPSTPGRIYRVNPNTQPGKQTVPKPGTPQSIRIESKNGVIVINGKKVDLPDSREMLALYSLKGKKLLSRAKDLVEVHIED